MTPKRAFKTVETLVLHFKSLQFSIKKYGINSTVIERRWEILPEGRKHRYGWLAIKYPKDQDLIYANLACTLKDLDIRYCDTPDIHDAFLAFKGRREGLKYSLQQDYKRYVTDNSTQESLIYKYVSGLYSPEFIILHSKVAGNSLESFYESSDYGFIKPQILKLIKYQDFFNHEKYLEIFNPESITT